MSECGDDCPCDANQKKKEQETKKADAVQRIGDLMNRKDRRKFKKITGEFSKRGRWGWL